MDTTSNPPSDPSPTPTRTKWILAALGAVLLLGTTVGIVSAQEGGDESNGDGSTEQQGPSEEDRAAFEAYRDCLAENGVERPDDGERPDRDSITDEQREAFRAAREACADVHPFAAEIAAFEACLAENGVERPDDGERPDPDSITDEQREAFRAAREACSDELPNGGEGRRGHHPQVDPEQVEAFKACLAENGVELPEDGERPDRDSITDEQREAFQAAREACADEAPFEGRGPGGPRGFDHGPRGFGPGGADEAPAGFPGGGPGALQGA